VLPIADQWYRRLLAMALAFGVAGGLFALGYSGLTTAGIDLFFSEPTSELFAGQWWWIPLVATGALIVVAIRQRTGLSGEVPGGIALVRVGWVDPSTAVQVIVVSVVSLIFGASLGPSLGIIVFGGGLGAWLVSRRPQADEAERQENSLAGMAGGLGAVFSGPLFASVMDTELSPRPKRDYVSSFVPRFIAAVVGYIIFFGVTSQVMLGAYSIPAYTFEWVHILYAPILGLIAAATLVAFTVIDKAIGLAAGSIGSPYLTALGFGALIGFIAFAVPLAASGGSSQLVYVTENHGALGVGLLIVVLIAKMTAVSLSNKAGFLGGQVFPMLFIGGTVGVLITAVVPAIPASLAVAVMIAAVPGAIIGAPVTFIILGVGTVGLGISSVAPMGIAIITAQLTVSALRLRRAHDNM
jgi:H+/Cl- antiporter ClcA